MDEAVTTERRKVSSIVSGLPTTKPWSFTEVDGLLQSLKWNGQHYKYETSCPRTTVHSLFFTPEMHVNSIIPSQDIERLPIACTCPRCPDSSRSKDFT